MQEWSVSTVPCKTKSGQSQGPSSAHWWSSHARVVSLKAKFSLFKVIDTPGGQSIVRVVSLNAKFSLFKVINTPGGQSFVRVVSLNAKFSLFKVIHSWWSVLCKSGQGQGQAQPIQSDRHSWWSVLCKSGQGQGPSKVTKTPRPTLVAGRC